MRPLGFILIIGLVGGCGSSFGPDRGDPAQYAFSQPFTYACTRDVPTLPDGMQLGLFDVQWGVRGDQATGEHVRRIVKAGGTVVHRFNLPLVRAILPASALPELGATAAFGVTDPHSLDVPIVVGFHTTIAADAVLTRGGTIGHVFALSPTLLATMPDDAIPPLRADARVRYVEGGRGIGCLE